MKKELKNIMMENMRRVNKVLAGQPMMNSERIAFLNGIMRECWEATNDCIDKGMNYREAEAIYTPYRKVFEDLIQHP